ncbi:MAG: phosphotransferase [Deltaproteobacteria bacterium]|nr:phosphotransferase [Deltaproteobacteria bacterium]
MDLQSDLNNERLTETIRRLMEEYYDLGKLTRVKEILGGYCNKNYAVWMSANDHAHRYFLRLYNPNVIENEILFEHALLNHLRSNGFILAATIVPCRNSATMVHTPPPENHQGKRTLWALFEFLEGEDKYSWTYTDLTDKEFISAAEILAHLHHCGHGFKKPPGADRVQPRIIEFIPTFKKTFSAFLEQADDRRCDRLFKDNFGLICKALDYAASFDFGFQGMLEIPIHCDYHPGNLKYRDEKCVGIFDFDWSKIDYRLFDVALGLVYFTSIWDDRAAGLRPDKFTLFLSVYNEACHRLTHINPLTKQEQRYLVPMLSIANLYVLNWDLVDFYNTPEPDDDEYYMFIDHNIGLMHWIAIHEDELELWVKNSTEL